MKRAVLMLMFTLLAVSVFGAGVLINRANTSFQYTHLSSCAYEVQITDQIAEVKVTEIFVNNSGTQYLPRLYFPVPRGASATTLRWDYGNGWQEAEISPIPDNPPGGPVSFPDYFVVYIQLMPLVFDFPDPLPAGSQLKVELTYVQMMNYNFGSVSLNLKNDYHNMQTAPLALQSLEVNVQSTRPILGFDILNVTAQTGHDAHTAFGFYEAVNQPATANYACQIFLSTAQYGSWGYSTWLDEVPDQGEPGFFVYNIEEASLNDNQPFTMKLNIVIDVSGSMTWENRLENAKLAAIYVINHLQANDWFNVILFDHVVRPLWSNLRTNTQANRNAAISYIQNYTITSLNGTNLWGGLSTALGQFSPPAAGTKNCVLLLSDGQPNVGVTDNYQMLNQVSTVYNNYDPYIFSFGVGTEVNYNLLSGLAEITDGFCIFLESSEMVNTIGSFYDTMRKPLLTNPLLSFSPGGIVSEVYPAPFPTIYGGIQYRVVGRYNTPGETQLNLWGMHESQPLTYSYPQTLGATEVAANSFVPKIWASTKIDKLVVQYYSYPPGSPQALSLKDQIIQISQDFGVVCIFTSFTPEPPTQNSDELQIPAALKLLGNHPNPFNPSTTISFEVLEQLSGSAEIRIYNLRGQLVKILRLNIDGKGSYQILWDGHDLDGRSLASGVYFYTISLGRHSAMGKMVMAK